MDFELYQGVTSIFQSDFWMEFNSKLYGMQSYKFGQFILLENNDTIYVSGITKNQLADTAHLISLVNFIKDINTVNKKVLIDFQILESDVIVGEITDILNKLGLVSTTIHIIPRQRLLLNLSETIYNIERNYKNKTLNDIKRAKKNGVIIIEDWDIDTFYGMYMETSKRQNFAALPYYYFEFLCNALRSSNKGKLLFSTKKDYSYFSSAIIAEHNNILYYLYTGSNHSLSYFNGSSVLQDYIIKWAKAQGYFFYDFMGIRNDFNFGPTKFKLKFSNNIIKLINTFTY